MVEVADSGARRARRTASRWTSERFPFFEPRAAALPHGGSQMAQGQTTPVATTARPSARSTGRTAAQSGLRVRQRASGEGRAVASRAADEASDVASTAQD